MIKLNKEESLNIAKTLWDSPKMQNYLIDKYDFYKTEDNLILELEKVNKISITKELYYDDEEDAPEVTETNFIIYNRHNIPGRNIEEYLKEKENLQNNGCAIGMYDYKGIYFTTNYTNNNQIVTCDWHNEHYNFKRYLTKEEQEEYINLMKDRKEEYLTRLKKYFKRYGKNITTHGYWVNR